jgi:hypothetical protein
LAMDDESAGLMAGWQVGIYSNEQREELALM